VFGEQAREEEHDGFGDRFRVLRIMDDICQSIV
jgi:hypothetical protein